MNIQVFAYLVTKMDEKRRIEIGRNQIVVSRRHTFSKMTYSLKPKTPCSHISNIRNSGVNFTMELSEFTFTYKLYLKYTISLLRMSGIGTYLPELSKYTDLWFQK